MAHIINEARIKTPAMALAKDFKILGDAKQPSAQEIQ